MTDVDTPEALEAVKAELEGRSTELAPDHDLNV